MKRRGSIVTMALLAMLFALAAPAGAAQDPPPGSPSGGPPPHADANGNRLSEALEHRLRGAQAGEKIEVIVTWDGPANVAAARAAAGPFAVLAEFSVIDGFLASVTPGQARALAAVPGVFRVDENFEVQATNLETDQEFGTESARVDFGVDGTGVDVCVLDTGADPNHEQLDSNIVAFHDSIGGLTTPYDDQGHGSHVAATIAGDGTGGPNAAKYQGIAPGANLYIAKVLNSAGSGSTAQIVDGIEWCIAMGVDIISASLGGGASDGFDPLSAAINNAVVNYGITSTIAAGNSGDGPQSVATPGAAEHALTVGAITKMSDGLALAPFSSRGPNLAGVLKPEVVSPGVSVISADAGTTAGYVSGSGTSMATPFTAGTVALMLHANPALTPGDVKALVASTSRDLGASGPDNNFGHGVIDGYALVSASQGGSGSSSLPAHTQLSASVPDNGLWSHQIAMSGDEVGQPIAITVTIEGSVQCTLSIFGLCLISEWTPDLDARLIAPDGTVTDSRCPLEGWCGSTGVQETFQVGAAAAGTYTLEVYPFDGSPNNGKGGSALIDLFTGSPSGTTPPPANQAPVADAGPDQTVADSDGVAGEMVSLDGSGSGDPDGTIVSYSWTEGGVEIETGANPSPVWLDDGTHTITLTVTDDDGATDTDTVEIVVEAPPANQAPVADAGPDQTVADSDGVAGEMVSLDGSGSVDPDGTIVSYSWTEGGVEIETGANPSPVWLDDGTHTITLTVTDDDGATDTDTVEIVVEAPPPPPPPPGSIHVHDLDDLSHKLSRGFWNGVAAVEVRDAGEDLVLGFTVTGTFTQNGWSAALECTDGEADDADGTLDGVCTLDVGQMPSKQGGAAFTVDDVTMIGFTYDGSANHDSDGDSDGTTIALSK